MTLRRREFLVSASAAGASALAGAAPSGKRRLRIGVMTDTHVGTTIGTCGLVKAALELFKEKGCDLVVNNGDIADHFYPTGYKAYRDTVESVYGGDPKRPREVYVYAWHDAFEFKPGVPRGDTEKYAAEAFQDVRKLLEAPNAPLDSFEMAGFRFLVFPQHIGHPGFPNYKEYEDIVASACRANPGKPVFVIDHPPPRGTTYNSWRWGDSTRRRILNKYPQVVVFSGHSHGSLRNDLFIWQKEFTVVNAGCLQVWRGHLVGSKARPKKAFGVLVADLFDDGMTVRRWDVRDGSEILPGKVWHVDFPFARETAPFNRGRLEAAETAPAFPASLKPSVSFTKDGSACISVPDAADGIFKYRVTAERETGGAWKPIAWGEMFSEYYLRKKDRTGKAEFVFKRALLDAGRARFLVCPVGQYGSAGAAVASDPVEIPPDDAFETVFETSAPAAELGYEYFRRKKGRIPVEKDGFHVKAGKANGRLRLPERAFSDRSAEYRVVFEAETRQPEDAWLFRFHLIGKEKAEEVLPPLTNTPFGESGPQRYAFAIPAGKAVPCDLLVDWGDICQIKFNALKIERKRKST